jgi:hypothetical protein
MDWDSLFLTPEHKADTVRMPNLHMYSPMDAMDVHVYGHLEVVATATSGGALVAASGGMQRCYALRSHQ